ncbi:DUF4261 domain-containing protein [Paenibacillus sp. CMAA1364]
MTTEVELNNKENHLTSDNELMGFELAYNIEFLYDQQPIVSMAKLYETIEQYTGKLKVSGSDGQLTSPFGKELTRSEEENKSHHVIFHMDHKVTFDDEEIYAQSCIYEPSVIEDYDRFERGIQQSFHWQNVDKTVEQCKYSLRIHDLYTAGIHYKKRLELLLGLVNAIQETAPCKAIYWHTSEKFVQPDIYLEAIDQGEKLYGAVNLRLYNTGVEKAMIMDTLGLSSLGIPDLQCHFYDMNPSEVARDLLGISKYLFDQGDIIQDGESIGTSTDRAYQCEHQHALVIPERYVLDLNAGPEHDATQIKQSK